MTQTTEKTKTATPTNSRAFMMHVRGRFYVRSFGAREYGSYARDATDGFELV